MPGFESEIGNKEVKGQPLREFSVSDDSHLEQRRDNTDYSGRTFGAAVNKPMTNEELNDFEQSVRQQRRDKLSGINRLNQGAKERINYLIGITRQTKIFEVGELKFELQTLKTKETREALVEAAKKDGTVESPFEIRKQFLARSLVSINNVDFENFIGSSNIEDKLDFVDELDDILITSIYGCYLELTQETRSKFEIDNKDKALEVAEDLKK